MQSVGLKVAEERSFSQIITKKRVKDKHGRVIE